MAEFTVTTDRDGTRSFKEHDDRWVPRGGPSRSRGRGRSFRGGNYNKTYYPNNNRSRGYNSSYSSRRGSGSYRGRGRGGFYDRDAPDPRSRLDDDGDDQMGELNDAPKNRYNPYGRPSRGSYKVDNRPQQIDSNRSGGSADTFRRLGVPIEKKAGEGSDWYKIIIPWGRKAEKEFILKSIHDIIDMPLVPTYFHFEGKNAVFFVNESLTADAIRGASRRITLPNGYKMTIMVKNSSPPVVPLGEEEMEKLKVVMSKRYDPATKALNLSSLHTDTDLASASLFLPLARPQVMTNVVKVVKQNIPELVALDVSNNKLVNLEQLGIMVDATNNMKIINLSKNKITHIDELRKLKKWNLDWIHLEGNPMCDKFNDTASYIR